MIKLVTLDAMKEHLQMDHDLDDDDIERKIGQASDLVLQYLDGALPDIVDSNGELVDDAVPETVRAATTILTQMLYKGELSQTDLEHGYLPKPVMNLLYPVRLPAMA